jgi:hypothetical protein
MFIRYTSGNVLKFERKLTRDGLGSEGSTIQQRPYWFAARLTPHCIGLKVGRLNPCCLQSVYE